MTPPERTAPGDRLADEGRLRDALNSESPMTQTQSVEALASEMGAAAEAASHAAQAEEIRRWKGAHLRDTTMLSDKLDAAEAQVSTLSAKLVESEARAESLEAERDEARKIAGVFSEHWPYGQHAARDEALRIDLCAVPARDALMALSPDLKAARARMKTDLDLSADDGPPGMRRKMNGEPAAVVYREDLSTILIALDQAAEATEAQAQELQIARDLARGWKEKFDDQARRVKELEAGLGDAIEDLLTLSHARWSEYLGSDDDLVGKYRALLSTEAGNVG